MFSYDLWFLKVTALSQKNVQKIYKEKHKERKYENKKNNTLLYISRTGRVHGVNFPFELKWQ